MTQPAGNPPADTCSETEDSASDLFAAKGGATPAPVRENQPPVYLVAENGDTSAAASAGDESVPVTADATGLFPAEELEPDRPAVPPAASLDAQPFDPARKRPLVYDDAPAPKAATPEPETPPAASGRTNLPTLVLTGAAAAAAIAALITAANWYFANEPGVPADVSLASAPPAAEAVAPPAPIAPPPEPAPAIAAPAAPAEPQPVIDLVRIEPGGATIIAGRAKPGTALIVLDNDQPLGSVVAGETGDWMLIPDRSLAGGEHEIALAIKRGEGAVSVATPAAPETAARPLPRPAGPADEARYVAQIASVKTQEGAAQEWAKLQAALPDLLGGYEPTIDSAELRDRGTFYRIRLGPFDDREQARALCSALVDAGRDCLVVRR